VRRICVSLFLLRFLTCGSRLNPDPPVTEDGEGSVVPPVVDGDEGIAVASVEGGGRSGKVTSGTESASVHIKILLRA
jgi:hypothetical protein